MRTISSELIKNKTAEIAIKANTKLRTDVLSLLKKTLINEKSALARKALSAIIDNARIALKQKRAICQDTGLAVVFVEIGNNVYVQDNINQLISQGIALGYKQGGLRASIQKDPISRKNKLAYAPIITHIDIVKGDKIKITVLPKGFGSENKAQVKMLNPTASIDDIEQFIVSAVKTAGAGACPPYIIGVGIGGTQDYAGLLAKKALLTPVTMKNKRKQLADLEQRLLEKINKLNIGAFGFGGKTTALKVNVLTYPTHIAGLPVAVNISCHALRSASAII
ncbi:MAG: fumarate hydratase [Candidatus Omnitrophica bacterium]|nr:fumarate hydratase [Candidatus Omnitrophota bacterium]